MVSIIIVSWQVKDVLRNCLWSLQQYTIEEEVEIIIVDNASHDGTVEMVKEEFPLVKLIPLTYNAGFAAANNLGAAQAQGEYILLLNPDTVLTSLILKPMLSCFNAQPNLGVLGCRLLNSDGSLQPSVRCFPGLVDQAWLALKLQFIWPKTRVLDRYLAKDFDYDKKQTVDQVMGACFMVARQAWEQLKGLDEGFWIWFEEVDFCCRAWKLDWQVGYTPQASLIHLGGQSFNQVVSFKKQWWFLRSQTRYFRKHGNFLVKLFWFLVVTPLSLIIMLIWISYYEIALRSDKDETSAKF